MESNRTTGEGVRPTIDSGVTRREMLGVTGKATAVVGIGMAAGAYNILPVHAEPISRPKRVGANDKLNIALIGCGGMGTQNLREFLKKPEIQVGALCDVDESHYTTAHKLVNDKYGKAPAHYDDYRKVLDQKDIDAVVIATPDHWHCLVLIHAVEAGKDAYCEKPISHDITEAKAMAAAVAHHKKVVQVGTWQRSTAEFVSAVEFIRSGKLGKVVIARAYKTDPTNCGVHPVAPVPAGFNYDMWCGPAPFVPFVPEHTHYKWRWFHNYGNGMTGDWGVHMMDIALLAMSKDTDMVMPTEVSGFGEMLANPGDDRQWVDTQMVMMRFKDPDFLLHWQTGKRPLDQAGPSGEGTQFITDNGTTLTVWRGGWRVQDPKGEDLPRSYAKPVSDHWQNFIDCVKTREQPRSNLASMAQTTIVCHLGNAAVFAHETVRFDKSKMDIVGRAGKNTLSYAREYRKGYKLPVYKA